MARASSSSRPTSPLTVNNQRSTTILVSTSSSSSSSVSSLRQPLSAPLSSSNRQLRSSPKQQHQPQPQPQPHQQPSPPLSSFSSSSSFHSSHSSSNPSSPLLSNSPLSFSTSPQKHHHAPTHTLLTRARSTSSNTHHQHTNNNIINHHHYTHPTPLTTTATATAQTTSLTSPPSTPSTTTTTLPSSSSSTSIRSNMSSIHPPLRLITTATCESQMSLVSARSPPHSPTFASFGLPTSGSGSSSTSRASSMLDGIHSSFAHSSTHSGIVSAAKESLADFAIAASKATVKKTNTTADDSLPSSNSNMLRSKSNYVSFPNFDDMDFVDVQMEQANNDHEEDEDEDDDVAMMDQEARDGWSTESRARVYRPSNFYQNSSSLTAAGQGLAGQASGYGAKYLLQLESYNELRVNGIRV